MAETRFLAICESSSPETGLIAMTGVLLNVRQFAELSKQFYDFHLQLNPSPNDVMSHLPELHAKDLLGNEGWATDEHRIKCFDFVADTIIQMRIDVIRWRHKWSNMLKLEETKKTVYGVLYMHLLWRIASRWNEDVIIPILDGLNEQGLASHIGLISEAARVWVLDEKKMDLATPNVCEAIYSSSKCSCMTQLADMATYILHVSDLEKSGRRLTGLEPKALEASNRIENERIYDCIQWDFPTGKKEMGKYRQE